MTEQTTVLTIGHSHEADQAWVSDLLAIRLPLYPNLDVRTDQSVLCRISPQCSSRGTESRPSHGTAGGPSDHRCTIRSGTALCSFPENHTAAQKEQIVLEDFAKDRWILFARRVVSRGS